MTAKIIEFPATAILRAVRQLQRPVSAEAHRMAASVLIEALVAGEAVPPGTLALVCSILLRTATTSFGVQLAAKLAELDDRIEILILGDALLKDPPTRAAGFALLRRLV